MIAAEVPGISQLAQIIINSLAVLGAFLVGYVLAALVGRWLERRRPVSKLNRASRLLAGLAFGLLAAIILFGHGEGWTLFGGGGDNPTHTPTGMQNINTAIVPSEPLPSSPPNADQRTITILGGTDVVDQRFYLLNDASKPMTFAELKAKLLEVAAAVDRKPLVEVRFPERNRLPHDHPAVTMLVRWLREDAGLTVTLPPERP